MADSIHAIEEFRRSARLTQKAIAHALGVTQGHYSKLASGKVPLTGRLGDRIGVLLEANGGGAVVDERARRLRELATSIRVQCSELMHLAVGVGSAIPRAAGRSTKLREKGAQPS